MEPPMPFWTSRTLCPEAFTTLLGPFSGRTSDPNVRLTVHNTGGIHHGLLLCYIHHTAVHGGSVMVYFPATLTVLQHRRDLLWFTALFTKPLAEPFSALPGTIPEKP